ncbi:MULTISPECIES: DUF1003 domain-containing protein [unclassified Mycobacterium]|uniref:DUF1003 domain-containing protein n=1 Tax=unclassified Mycobacterium TaxID=2642494 RepID=UPI0029C860D7|nr:MULTISPECIES: DUF1003 domain-containing protein [unclassified Mycobacterium]
MSTVPTTHLHPHISPALLKHAEERANSLQNRIADKITTFAGSMAFVYLHVVWFAVWIVSGTLLGFDSYPFGLLTMIVSLEAIFLSTFVMISQNRADAKRQVIADHQWQLVQEEDKQNCQLLQLSQQILELTRAVHQYMGADTPAAPGPGSNGEADVRH